MSQTLNFDDWRAELETFIEHKLEEDKVYWARWLYDYGYGPWNAFIAYQRSNLACSPRRP